MMRISTQQVFSGGLNRLQDLNTSLNQTQQQVSSGKRVLNPSDDPVAAARILKLNQEVSQIDQFKRATDLAQNRLEQEEATLGEMVDSLQRVRELTVQAGNGTLSPDDRASVAAELREKVEQMASIANTRDASGEYIFSGFKGETQAFARNVSGDWVYQGDEGQRQLEIDEGVKVPINDTGKRLFVDVPTDQPSFTTSASPNNTSGATITSGMVLDQDIYNSFYNANNEDLVVDIYDNGGTTEYGIRRQSTSPSSPPVPGDYLESGTYTSGDSIQFQGIQFEISGAQVGDRFEVNTAEKQSMFATVEKLIYGLENQAKTPAEATIPAASYVGEADDTLTINGVSFTGNTTLAGIRDAINTSNDDALEKVEASLDSSGNLQIVSQAGDLSFSANDGGTGTGQIQVQGAKFEDLDLQNGPTSATVGSGQQAYDELIANSLKNLDNAQSSILQVQTDLGGRLNAVDSTREFLTDSSVFTEEIRSKLQDVDYAEAISELSFQSFVLQAAQQSFAQTSQLSLFDSI
ncbi:flagellar hook-associated protein 3 [Tamilnaduibacter salinus]|uniref:Flagellar hook-associated protein 3 n=1 Tax=Tamilnaduibacter salinus TaxID=1484056 RepID=A0A2A2I4A0_9GAMM|nr:flagellar hook-associated protein FlgL [Tamilnaduibacter salinus]PAV26228.1 flagellar hook-associated protein 3 [Tamilnaduibacter salinus]